MVDVVVSISRGFVVTYEFIVIVCLMLLLSCSSCVTVCVMLLLLCVTLFGSGTCKILCVTLNVMLIVM